MKTNDQAFTPAQEEAMKRVYDILKEHFEGSILSVVTDIDGHEHKEAHTTYWHGGRIRAIGLAQSAVHKLMNKPSEEN